MLGPGGRQAQSQGSHFFRRHSKCDLPTACGLGMFLTRVFLRPWARGTILRAARLRYKSECSTRWRGRPRRTKRTKWTRIRRLGDGVECLLPTAGPCCPRRICEVPPPFVVVVQGPPGRVAKPRKRPGSTRRLRDPSLLKHFLQVDLLVWYDPSRAQALARPRLCIRW